MLALARVGYKLELAKPIVKANNASQIARVAAVKMADQHVRLSQQVLGGSPIGLRFRVYRGDLPPCHQPETIKRHYLGIQKFGFIALGQNETRMFLDRYWSKVWQYCLSSSLRIAPTRPDMTKQFHGMRATS